MRERLAVKVGREALAFLVVGFDIGRDQIGRRQIGLEAVEDRPLDRVEIVDSAEEAAVAAQLASAPDSDDSLVDDEDEGGSADEEENIEEEPLSELVERLDATVFSLIEALERVPTGWTHPVDKDPLPFNKLEHVPTAKPASTFAGHALDADRADLPQLLDEVLKGSLWARQIEGEGESIKEIHQMVFKARANLIWSVTTPRGPQGSFRDGGRAGSRTCDRRDV